MIISFICAAALLNCTDEPTGTDVRNGGMHGARRELSAATTLVGCTKLVVTVGGLDSIRISETPRTPACGPLHPEIGDTPQFDHTTGLVRLPLVIANTGTQTVRAPARLYGWADSLDLLDPPGLNNPHSAGYVDFLSADSTLAAGAPLFGGAFLWRFDTLLASSGVAQTLAAGARSRVRWVELRAQKGAHVFQVEFWAGAQQASAPVPEVAPDTIPLAFMDSLGVLVGQSGKYIKDMIFVGFDVGTAQATRQAVIDAVNGTVVGGYRAFGSDGFYYVHISGGTLNSIWDALDKVRAFPEVVAYGPIDVSNKSIEAYRQPVDGAGWRTWHLDPEHVNEADKTWPFEQIDAPMAWGCTIGSSSTQVAVVDQGLYDADNLHKNVQFASLLSPDTIGMLTRPHGTLVGGVLAAAGNDSAGSTGVMWNAGLMLFEYLRNPVDTNTFVAPTFGHDFIQQQALAHYVLQAALLGARVINLSMGVPWAPGYQPSEQSREDRAKRESGHTALKLALKSIAASPTTKTLLIVIAAGNDSLDAKWSGLPEAKLDYPEQVLVIGGTTSSDNIWEHSDFGSLVDVYAPANHVYTINQRNADTVVAGTSFAAPLASGVAGLLFSFDPALSTPDVRHFIIDGVRLGGSSGALPILDAYGALRLAAQRPGAPLCGNRVWLANNQLIAARGTGVEPLFTYSATAPVPYPDVFHGGRRIDISTAETHLWDPNTRTWPQVPYGQSTDNVHSASFFSAYGFSHDLDLSATASVTVQSAFQASGVLQVTNRRTGSSQTVTNPLPLSSATTKTCVREHLTLISPTAVDYHCDYTSDSVSVGSFDQIVTSSPGMAPQGSFVLVAITTMNSTTSWGADGFAACDGSFTEYAYDSTETIVLNQAPSEICSNPGVVSRSAVHAEVFRVDSATGTWIQLVSLPNTFIGWIGLNERQDEFVLGRSSFVENSTEKIVNDPNFVIQSRIVVTSHSTACADGHVEYRSMKSPGTVLTTLPMSDPTKCPSSYLGIGNMAPSRLPRGAGPVLPNGAFSRRPTRSPAGARRRRLYREP